MHEQELPGVERGPLPLPRLRLALEPLRWRKSPTDWDHGEKRRPFLFSIHNTRTTWLTTLRWSSGSVRKKTRDGDQKTRNKRAAGSRRPCVISVISEAHHCTFAVLVYVRRGKMQNCASWKTASTSSGPCMQNAGHSNFPAVNLETLRLRP